MVTAKILSTYGNLLGFLINCTLETNNSSDVLELSRTCTIEIIRSLDDRHFRLDSKYAAQRL